MPDFRDNLIGSHHKGVSRNVRSRRRGSVYIAVLGVSMLTIVVGWSALTLLRIERRAADREGDFEAARVIAQSGLDLALLWIEQDLGWRDGSLNGGTGEYTLGEGAFSVEAIDENDNDLSDSEDDTARLVCVGKQGEARCVLSVEVEPVYRAMNCLNACASAGDFMEIKGGDRVEPVFAPISTMNELKVDGLVYGDAEGGWRTDNGYVYGTLTIPAKLTERPDPSLVDEYIKLATVVSYTGHIDKQVWGPGYTPSGKRNSDGVYYLDTQGHDIDIKDSRIYGTLIIRATGKIVRVKEYVLLHSVRTDYPTLIVIGDLELDFRGDGYSLDEMRDGINFNRSGVPYDGYTDNDAWDHYPSEIRGLVYCTDDIVFKNTSIVRGLVVTADDITFDGSNKIVHDPGIAASLPMGFTIADGVEIIPGSWQRLQLP